MIVYGIFYKTDLMEAKRGGYLDGTEAKWINQYIW